MHKSITPEMLLAAYANGYFPMAESRESKELRWFSPKLRGVLPIEAFHISRSLRKFARAHPFAVTCNRAFGEVIRACAEPGARRGETWINDEIIALYCALHRAGYAHSIECWRGEHLVGGVYGIALGGTFFGESMFSRETGASKIALIELVRRLREAGYTLLDAQYVNPHLLQFGIQAIPRAQYLARLETALKLRPGDAFKAA